VCSSDIEYYLERNDEDLNDNRTPTHKIAQKQHEKEQKLQRVKVSQNLISKVKRLFLSFISYYNINGTI
jgi:hypothetical protein